MGILRAEVQTLPNCLKVIGHFYGHGKYLKFYVALYDGKIFIATCNF